MLKECRLEQIKSTYTAAVVELNVVDKANLPNIEESTQRLVDIIKSNETSDVDILVFPEAILNPRELPIFLSDSMKNGSLCDNRVVHSALRNISCAVRETTKYVVINPYINSNCTEDAIQFNDHRPCTDPKEQTNLYNMAIVFDRSGAIIAT